MKKLLFLLLFTAHLCSGQQLTDKIYTELDNFTAAPSIASITTFEEKLNNLQLLAKTEAEHMAIITSYYNLGYYFNKFGNIQKSIDAYETAWKRYNKHNISGYDMVDSCLLPLSTLYIKQSDFLNAENILRQCISNAKSRNNNLQKSASIIQLSVIYNNTGKHNTAIAILEDALQNNKPSKSQIHKMQNNIASNHIALGNYDKASTYLKQNLSNKQETQLTTYKSLAYIAKQQEDYKQAHTYLNLAKETLTQQLIIDTRSLAKLHFDEAQLYYSYQKNKDCKQSLDTALALLLPNYKANTFPNKENLYSENTFIDLFNLYAEISNTLEAKLKFYNLSLYTQQLLNNKWTFQETKIIHRANYKNTIEKCIALLFNTYTTNKDISYLKRAFLYMEDSRAAVLKEHTSTKSILARHPNDSLLIKQQQLQQEQEQTIDLLIRAQLKRAPGNTINRLTNILNNTTLNINDINAKINRKYPTTNSSISFDLLQKKLKADHATLLAYFFGTGTIYQFVVTHKTVAINTIDTTPEFYQNITQFNKLFDDATAINNDINNFTNIAYNTYESLNFGAVSTAKNIVLLPDNIINFISFESLLSKPTTTTSFSKMPFVALTQRIAYHNNTSFYLNSKVNTTANSLLGVFPVFKGSPQELHYSVDEANAIQNSMSATLLMNSNASKANFITNAAKHNILHLSTHANSGNHILPASIQFVDDFLLLKELYSLDFTPKLVVLSACETGIGKSLKGEGVMSIARGFQYAGAEALLFSLWKINDRSTSKLMDKFYRSYSSTNTAFIANHKAKVSYLTDPNISNTKKSPYYWNAFVYYGPIVAEKIPIPYYWIIGALVVLIIVFLALKRKQNGKPKKNTP